MSHPDGSATSAIPSTLVVIDTDVASNLYFKSDKSKVAKALKAELKARLAGKLVVIAAQTEAELRAWPLVQNWGPNRTLGLVQRVDALTTVDVTREVINAFASLTAAAKLVGHPIFQKIHNADRWVAATAIALGRPLMTQDEMYLGTPGLILLP